MGVFPFCWRPLAIGSCIILIAVIFATQNGGVVSKFQSQKQILRVVTLGDDVNCIRSIPTLLRGYPTHMEGSNLLPWCLPNQFTSHTGTKN